MAARWLRRQSTITVGLPGDDRWFGQESCCWCGLGMWLVTGWVMHALVTVHRLELCSSGREGLWYLARLTDLWLQVGCGVPWEDVLLYQTDMFPGPVVFSASSLNVIASWGWRAVISQGYEEYFLPGVKLQQGFALCALSKYCFWVFILAIKWFQTASIFMGVDTLPGHWIILFCRISIGKGIIRPMGVDHRSSRSSREVPASWQVMRAVLIILTCHSMKPLHWGKWVEEVVWSCWHCGNCSNSSETKGCHYQYKFCWGSILGN